MKFISTLYLSRPGEFIPRTKDRKRKTKRGSAGCGGYRAKSRRDRLEINGYAVKK